MESRNDRFSSLRKRKLGCDVPLPVWSRNLRDAQAFNGNWIIGISYNYKDIEDTIESYCRSLPCDFVKSHPSNYKEKKRILWQMKDIPFSGIPFCLLSHDVHRCSFSMAYNSKKSKKFQFYETPSLDEDLEVPPLNGSIRKICPAQIIIKKIRRYMNFSLPSTATKKEKLSSLRSLKGMSERESTEVEDLYWIRIPLPSQHNHSFQGKLRLIHHSLRAKIKEYVHEGVTCPDRLKSLLTYHVQEHYQNSTNPPSSDDAAYYPSVVTIKNIVYNFLKRRKAGVRRVNGELKRKPVKSQSMAEESGSLKKPSTLQDVVLAFCSDSNECVLQTSFGEVPSEREEILTLKKEIGERIDNLRVLTESLNDVKKLQTIFEYLVNIPNIVKEPRAENVKLDSFSSQVIPDGVYSHASTYENCIRTFPFQSNSEPNLVETNLETHQIVSLVPVSNNEVACKDDATRNLYCSPPISYEGLPEVDRQIPHEEFLPSTPKVLHQLQNMPHLTNTFHTPIGQCTSDVLRCIDSNISDNEHSEK